MSEYVRDDEVSSLVLQAEALLAKLHLSAEENAFAARELAAALHDEVTRAHLALPDSLFGRARAVSAAGALALALITVDAWARRTDKDFPEEV